LTEPRARAQGQGPRRQYAPPASGPKQRSEDRGQMSEESVAGG